MLKKWYVILPAAAVLFLAAVFILLLVARGPLLEERALGEELALEQQNVERVDEVFLYNGSTFLYSTLVTNEDESRDWVFLNEEETVERINAADTITLEEAETRIMEDNNVERLKKVTPGIEEGIPVYEGVYEAEGRLQYYYIRMADGEFIKRYSFRKD